MDELADQEARIRLGGGPKAIERQHEKGRLTARERIAELRRSRTRVLRARPVGRVGHVRRVGRRPSAGVVTGIGTVAAGA